MLPLMDPVPPERMLPLTEPPPGRELQRDPPPDMKLAPATEPPPPPAEEWSLAAMAFSEMPPDATLTAERATPATAESPPTLLPPTWVRVRG